MGSAAASAAVRRALAPKTGAKERTKQWNGLRVWSGPRGRGPLRPRRARSPKLLYRSDSGRGNSAHCQVV